MIISGTFTSFSQNQGYALNFDGINDYVKTSYQGISGNSPRTVKAWIRTTAVSDPGLQKIITDWGTTSIDGGRFTLNMFENNALRIELQDDGLHGSIAINDGIWHHVAVTYDPDSVNKFSLYVDGVLDVSGNIPVDVNTILSTNFRIGMRVDDVRNFVGDIDEVSVWDRALSHEEIINYACISGDPTQIDNLVAYYKFNEGEGDVLTDLVDGNNGTMINMGESDWILAENCITHAITFTILEEDGTTPVEDAAIGCDGFVKYTNEYGETIFNNFEPGVYDFIVSKSGYSPLIGEVEVVDEDVFVVAYLLLSSVEEVSNNKFHIYPNPNNGLFNLKSDIIPAYVEIINATGELIHIQKINQHETEINLLDKTKGIYFLRYIYKDAVTTTKIIKMAQ